MIKQMNNISLTLITENEEIKNKFNAQIQILSADEVIATEKITKKYEANPKVYESDTISISLDKDGFCRVFVKKFDPKSASDFLAGMYEDMKEGLICLTKATKA